MTRENLQEILAALVPFGKQQIEDRGACPPVAASLDGGGDIDLHLPPVGEGGESGALLDLLKETLRQGVREGRYEATGLLMEVRAERMGDPHPVDALCIHLEGPGEAIQCFVPYDRDDDGAPVWGETFFGPADAEVFPANGAA